MTPEQALADAERNEALAEDLRRAGLTEDHPLVVMHVRRAKVARSVAKRLAQK